jgi:hypothetical protein
MTCALAAYIAARIPRRRRPIMTDDHAKVLATLTENLRKINSLRDFVAGVEVGAKSPPKC